METRISGLTKLFEQSIGVEEPWYIRSIETKDAEVHVYVDIREGNLLPCPECGRMCVRAGYEKEERVWRHGDCLFYPCYVHCRRPRVRCGEHKTKVVEAPWARKSSRFTLMFEGYAMLLLADMPILKASKLLRCNEKSLTRVLRYKFHVKKLLLDALDEVRKSEQQEQKVKRKFSKKLLMIPETRQTKEQRDKVAQLSREYPKTGRAFRMVQALDTVYASSNEETAKERLEGLYRWMRRSRLEPMKRVAKTLRSYFEEILNFFRSRLTNAICEGINSMIQAAKRKARGYHTFEGFSSMIYLIAAKLSLAFPNPLRYLE